MADQASAPSSIPPVAPVIPPGDAPEIAGNTHGGRCNMSSNCVMFRFLSDGTVCEIKTRIMGFQCNENIKEQELWYKARFFLNWDN